MGLDVSHDCWHGAYSEFHRWRSKIAEVAGLPPLDLMEGFYKKGSPTFDPCWRAGQAKTEMERLDWAHWDRLSASLPIKWYCLKDDVLYELLWHSDCGGELPVEILTPLADRLQELIPLLPDEDEGGHIGNWRAKTREFVSGLRVAAERMETVEFG